MVYKLQFFREIYLFNCCKIFLDTRDDILISRDNFYDNLDERIADVLRQKSKFFTIKYFNVGGFCVQNILFIVLSSAYNHIFTLEPVLQPSLLKILHI